MVTGLMILDPSFDNLKVTDDEFGTAGIANARSMCRPALYDRRIDQRFSTLLSLASEACNAVLWERGSSACSLKTGPPQFIRVHSSSLKQLRSWHHADNAMSDTALRRLISPFFGVK